MPLASLPTRTNVADRLTAIAARMPDAVAIATAGRGDVAGKHSYATCSFGELEADSLALARGLVDLGIRPGQRLVLLVKPGIEFVKLVFALLRTGAVTVLVDPGMGRKHLVNCLAAAEPDGFIAISPAQAVRTVLRRRFPRATLNVTVGRRWFWGGVTYRQLLARGRHSRTQLPNTNDGDAAAIIFTSGSTGPPKGVLYTHQMFDTQSAEIERQYGISPGGADLACFALFGLFNSAMGVTTVFPRMDFSRPASVDPRRLLAAANDWQVSQAFASPAVWDRLSRHCEATGEQIPTLRKVFSCGAPVPATVLERTLAMVHPEVEMHTPYGATESLPVATIEAREVLGETAATTNQGAGVCVGRKFDTIDWRVIRISDEQIATIEDVEELPTGEIGELIVRGPQVSPEYVVAVQPPAPKESDSQLTGSRPLMAPSPLRGGLGRGADAGYALPSPLPNPPPQGEGTGRFVVRGSSNQLANEHASASGTSLYNLGSKIDDGDHFWHRLGDVGYLDDQDRFWYCGRKAQRVETASGPLYTECCEAIFNAHPDIRRTALVGVGPRGNQTPVMLFEPHSPRADIQTLAGHLRALAERRPMTSGIYHFVVHHSFPVDVRHNAKINREQLAIVAAQAIAPSNTTGGR